MDCFAIARNDGRTYGRGLSVWTTVTWSADYADCAKWRLMFKIDYCVLRGLMSDERPRHCEERSDKAIQTGQSHGLLRYRSQ
jgi:hypothetical protein